jgi:NAD-dependent SIR2 family protein deacetylase
MKHKKVKVDFGIRCMKCQRKIPDKDVSKLIERTGICPHCLNCHKFSRRSSAKNAIVIFAPTGKSDLMPTNGAEYRGRTCAAMLSPIEK